MESYDVLIVGAGPAGLTLAKELATEGVNVLAIDKKQEIGAPKRCAEGLSLDGFKRAKLKPKKEWAVQKIRGAKLYSPSGEFVEIDYGKVVGYILERKIFEKDLAREAAKKGATIKAKTEAYDFERKEKEIIAKIKEFDEEKKIRTKIVAACDGIESLTARKLGLDTTNNLKDVDSGFQYEMANIKIEDPELLHLYFGNKIAPRGYVWVFPKGKHYANVGVGIAGYESRTAKSYLDSFIRNREELSSGSIIEANAGGIPVGGLLKKMTADNLVVVGDAAHQVNPIHGGGIALAMEAAIIASEVITEAIRKENYSDSFLDEYNKKWWAIRGKALERILKIRHMVERMKDDDFEILAKNLNGEDILTLADANVAKTISIITRKLIKHPSLLKFMLKYLKAKE
ncbi:MAG: NAD(P)/FAD-dependent oxidoreductase [Candidatus Diapherotrites archaeon]|nr:NAD(P)/FAD-dependent oxidoreductase [Candidatus Diapherotrites archaeon]